MKRLRFTLAGMGATLVTWPAAAGTLHRAYIAQDLSGFPPLLTLPEIEGSPAMLLLFGAISWDPNYEALSADLLPLEQQFQLGHLIGRIPEIRQTSFNGGAGAGLAPTGPQKFFRVRRMPFDADGDSLSWEEEVMIYGTNPHLADTDGDGMSDLDEIISGTNPAVSNIIAQKLRVVVPDRENDRSSPNDGNIELRWEPPTGPNFTEVQVQQSTNGGFWETLATLAKTISTYPISNLLAGVSYDFRMVSVTTPDRSISSTVSYTVPLIKALEVRAVFSTFLYPADFRSRLGGVPIKYTKLQSSYLYRRETEDFTTVTRKTYSHELFPLVGSEKAHGFGSTSKSFLDGSPDRHEVWSDDFQHAEPQLRTLIPGASALAWQSSSTSHADPDYEVTHSLSATLQRGDAASVGNSGYPTIGGIVQTNQGPFFEPASGPISISLIDHWWAGIAADPNDESVVEETASNVYTGEFSTAEMVRVGNESLQAFNPVWNDRFWRWDVARFASFAGYQTNVSADYRYVKGNGFEASNPGSSIDCSLGWRNLMADETWYGVERGEARLQVNPPASDTHVLMLHRFQPESAPDPDPEDGYFPPPAVPEYRIIDLLIRAGERTSTSTVIDPIASDAFVANRDGVHSLSLLPFELETRDRGIAGAVQVPAGWQGFSLKFEAAGKDLDSTT